jgi:uncharacterized protein (DUF1800 family)
VVDHDVVPSAAADVAHLLRRVGFGVTPADLARWTPLDRTDLIDAVLDPGTPPPAIAPAELSDPSKNEYQRWVAMTQWWFDRMATASSPLAEKLTLFWHGHLTSSAEKAPAVAMFEQNQLFRSAGLGSSRELFQAASIQPAMLLYLDNFRNRKGAPNENFARESLELFTIGVNRYTQDDVVAVARAWTGFGLTSDRTAFLYDGNRHDTGTKTVFGITRRWTGPEVIDEVLRGSQRVTAARFLATRLWSFLAYPEPEPEVVAAVADAYLAADLSVRALVRAILHRPEFWSAKARGALVRSPVEYVVAAMRATGLPSSVARPEWWLADMGQRPFYPPNVSGWRPNGSWISSTSMWGKARFASYLRWEARKAGVLEGTGALTVSEAVTRALRTYGVHAPSARTREALEAFVRAERAGTKWAEQANLSYCTLLSPDFQLA